MFWIIVKVSLRSLAANKLRSVLAMLGIIIGVWAVIAVLALVAGARESVMNRITALGTNLLIVVPGQKGTGGVMSGTQENFTLDDAADILYEVNEIKQVAPVVRGSVQVKYFNNNSRSTVLGTSVTYFPIRDFQVERGTLISDADADRLAHVAVIGPTTATNLFGNRDALDQTIKLNGINFRVIGVLKSKGDQGWFNPDDQIIIPYTTAMKQILGIDYLQELDVQAKDEKQLNRIESRVTEVLRHRHRLLPEDPDDFRIHNQAEVVQMAGVVNNVLTLLLGGIAGVSLLVGGIGIMNIMLVTVTERTREIGIRKAIGAKDRDILRQFLLESVLMSALGGMIGVALGVLTARTISAMNQSFTLRVQLPSVVLALGFSAAVGIFFGYYPARRAAKLDPIEALRYE